MDKPCGLKRWSAELCPNRLPLGSRTDKANTGFLGPHGVGPSNRSKSELIMDRGARLPSSVARNTNSPGNSGTSIGKHSPVSTPLSLVPSIKRAECSRRPMIRALRRSIPIGKAMGRSLDEYRFPGEGEDAFCLACEGGNPSWLRWVLDSQSRAEVRNSPPAETPSRSKNGEVSSCKGIRI